MNFMFIWCQIFFMSLQYFPIKSGNVVVVIPGFIGNSKILQCIFEKYDAFW